MKILVDMPDKMYRELLTWKFSTEVSYRAINAITKGKIIPKDAEILTAEEYSDLCLRASHEQEQESVLDKIRAEIEQLRLQQFLTSDNKVCIDSQDVLNVIDKYTAESEEGAEDATQ